MATEPIRAQLRLLQEEVDTALKLLDVQLPQNVAAFQRSLGTILQIDRTLQSHVNNFVAGMQLVQEESKLVDTLGHEVRSARTRASKAFALSLELDQILTSPPLLENSYGAEPLHTTAVTYAWSPAPPSSVGPVPYSARNPYQRPFSASQVRVKSLLQLAQRLGSQSQPPVSDPLAQSSSGRGMIGDALNSLASPFSDEVFPLLGGSGLRLSRLHCSLQLLLMAAQQRAAGEFGFLTAEELLAGSAAASRPVGAASKSQPEASQAASAPAPAPAAQNNDAMNDGGKKPFESDLEWDDE